MAFQTAAFKGCEYQLAFFLIHGLKVRIVGIWQVEGVSNGFLRGMMHGKCDELMGAKHGLHKVGSTKYPADFPASHAKQLSRATHGHCAFKHIWKRGDGNMLRRSKDQVFIYL